jgi:hypothetical protein
MNPGHTHAGVPGLCGRQRHRRDAQPTAHERHRPRAARKIETMTERTETADHVALDELQHLRGAGADRLEDHLDAVAGGFVDGERPPQERPGRPAEVDELAGSDRMRDLGCVQ